MKGTPEERFLAKVDKKRPGGCWVWVASYYPTGYSKFWDGEVMTYAHRWSYEHHVGPIPSGFQIDHLCRNRGCVNPNHLEAVTQQENIRRGEAGIRQREKTHCPQGHPYLGDNLHVYITKRGTVNRVCQACNAARGRRRRAAERAALGM